MHTTIYPSIKGSLFYIPFFWSGQVIGMQAIKFSPYTSYSEIHQKANNFLTQFLRFPLVSDILLYLSALICVFIGARTASNLIRKYRRKKQFYNLQISTAELTAEKKPNLIFVYISITILSIICGPLICHAIFPIGWLHEKSIAYLANLGADLNTIPAPFTFASAIIILFLGTFIYSLLMSSKHGPICKSYHIRGSLGGIKALFSLLWKKAKVNRFGINLQTEDLIGVSKQNSITELVTTTDYQSKNSQKYYLGHSEEYEPHEVKPEVSREQVEKVIEHLQLLANQGEQSVELNRDNCMQIARKGHFYEMVTRGELGSLNIDQVEHILRAMRQENCFSKEGSSRIANYVVNTKVFDMGGMFNELIFKDENDSFIPFVRLRENPLQTRHVSVQEYGPQAIENGKLLVVTSFTAFDSKSDEESDSHEEDVEAFGSERNTIRENHKPLNRILIHGLGASYSFIHKDSRYVYDEWWTGSFKPIMRIFPGVHDETSPRRIGYIREIGGKTVAKISDVDPFLKIVGTYNRDIDIYCPTLANDNNFGARLCLFSQFLTHQVIYRRNLSQQMLSLNPKYSAGDIDQSQH